MKIIIKLILLAAIGTVGGLYYFWQEVTKVPTEYTEAIAKNKTSNSNAPLLPAQINKLATISKNKISDPIDRAKVGEKIAVKLTDRDLNNLIIAGIATSQANKQIPAAIKGINTKIEEGKIYTGALVNLDRLVRDGQPGSQIAALGKLTDKLPMLKNRDVYIGIVGKPVLQGNKIELDRDTQIKVGNVNFNANRDLALTAGSHTKR